MSGTKNLKWGIIFSYITMVVGIIVSLTYTPFLLRMLGQQQYGLYNMGQAAVSYLGLTEFGFGNAVVRYAAKYRAEGKEEKTAALYGMFMHIYNFLAAIIFVVGIIICIFSSRFYTVSSGAEGYRQLRIIILIMVVNLTFTFMTTTYSSIITAYERFTFSKITNLLYTVLKPLVMIPLLLWGYKAITLSGVTLVLTVGLNVANIYYVKKVLKVSIDMRFGKIDFGILKEIVNYSFFIFLGTIVAQLNEHADTVILGVISGEVAVATYSVGYQLSSYIQQIPGIVTSVFFPKVTMKITRGASLDEMSELMIKVGRIQYYIIFLLCSGFCLFGKEFIFLWAGDKYGAAYWIVLALILSAAIPNMQSMPVLIIQALNKHQFKAITYVLCAVINVILSIPTAIMFGPIGCAVCTGIATIVARGIIINWYYQKKICLNIKKFWQVILTLTFKFMPLIVVGIFIKEIITTTKSWFMLLLGIAVYTCIFAAYTVKVCMNSDEKRYLETFLK